MESNRKTLITPLLLFAAASCLWGLYAGLYDPSFNNYLSQVHNIDEVARGALEFPRELPGFLCAFIFSLFMFLADTRIAALMSLLLALSLWGQGFLAPNMSMVVLWMLMWSTGAHVYMVVKSSIALRLADKGREGKLMGDLGALEALGLLLGMTLVYFGVSYANFSFPVIFGLAGTFTFIAALLLYGIKAERVSKAKPKLLLKRKYGLFYLINMIFGARKQVFLTFAPWVLIKIFHCGVESFALLGIIATLIGLVFRPLLGRAIDAWGERKVLSIDAILVTSLCILYAFAQDIFSDSIALIIIMSCFVADQVLFAITMARVTYLNRIVDSSADLAPSISMGITLDHGVSMTVPFLGGLLWASLGYQAVFIAAGILGLLSLVVARFIPPSEPQEEQGKPDGRVSDIHS
jgi:predicted MFS family arabinose efflux permease